MKDDQLALYVMLGQTAERAVAQQPDTVPRESLPISESFDLALVLPQEVRRAGTTAEVFKLFFVFENFLRNFVLQVLSEDDKENWWNKIPPHIRTEVDDLEATEEAKAWMAFGSREKIALTTYGQLLAIIDSCWKLGFEAIVKDKYLLQEARHIAHIRNAACHMADVPEEERSRVKQVLRDWFRVVSP